MNILTLSGLVASQDLIIPVQAQYYAMEGLKQLLDTYILVKNHYNEEIKILGILLTMFEEGTALCQDVEEQLRDYFGGLVFKSIINRNIRLAEAPSAGESIFTYAPDSDGAPDYLSLAREILRDEAEIRSSEENFVNI